MARKTAIYRVYDLVANMPEWCGSGLVSVLNFSADRGLMVIGSAGFVLFRKIHR